MVLLVLSVVVFTASVQGMCVEDIIHDKRSSISAN